MMCVRFLDYVGCCLRGSTSYEAMRIVRGFRWTFEARGQSAASDGEKSYHKRSARLDDRTRGAFRSVASRARF